MAESLVVKEINVEYFYTKQPKTYESERVTIGFTMVADQVMVDNPGFEEILENAVDMCMSVVHKRLGLYEDDKPQQAIKHQFPDLNTDVPVAVVAPSRRRR